jgi:excisionase family DNA binding protein
MKQSYTIAQAAQVLGVHRDTVSAWVASGRIPATREGRAAMIQAADLAAMTSRTCTRCGASFTAADPRKVFCSRACAVGAAKDRFRASHPPSRGPGRPPKQYAPAPAPAGPVPERLAAALAHVTGQNRPRTAKWDGHVNTQPDGR